MISVRRLILVFLLACLPASFAFAQTPTPTKTPTNTAVPTPTITPSPDLRGFVYPGAIQLFGGTSAPTAFWLPCDGSAVSRTTYAALFAVIGTTYGAGDGSTTFNLPDFRGRLPLGAGAGTGLSTRVAGGTVGSETHTLTITEMPPHNHPITARLATGGLGSYSSVGTGFQASQGVAANLGSQNTGGGAAFNIMNPSLVVNYYIYSGETLAIIPTGGGPTPTALMIGTPDGVTVYSTVAAPGGNQAVAVRYEVTAGDAMIAILLFLICGLTVLKMVLATRKTS